MTPGRCRTCHWFERDPHRVEHALPGLAALSSALGASRSGDGWCLRHDRMLAETAGCSAWDATPG